MSNGFIDVFKNKNFLKLWLSQVFSQTANHLFNFLLVVKVFDLTHSSLKVSILILCFTVPSILFSIYAGILADRFSQKKIMYTVNFLRAILALGFIFFDLNLVFVYLFTFLIGSLMQFFLPSEAARIPALVDRKDYLAANSLYISTNYAAMIVGFSLVSFIQYLKGEHQFLLISMGFLISALVLLTLPYDKPEFKEVNAHSLFDGIKKEFSESWNAIKKHPGIFMPIIYLVFIWITFGVAYVIVPPLAKGILHIPTADAGKYVVLPAVAGAILGGYLCERLGRRKKKSFIINIGLFLVGGVSLIVSLIPIIKGPIQDFAFNSIGLDPLYTKMVATVVLVGLVGMGAMMVIAPAQTMLQENTGEGMMGRVFGFLNMMTNVVNMLPVLAIGYIADRLPINSIIFVLASMVLLFWISNTLYIVSRKKPF